MRLPPAGYQWDPEMDAKCLDTYAFDFLDVVRVFDDPGADYLVYGPYDHAGEERYVAIGRMEWGTIVAVVYTMRGDDKRLIWVRPARKKESAAFCLHNGIEAP
jgi:uncharacterized DUF497 family protein